MVFSFLLIIASACCIALPLAADQQQREQATFAGGCFWCVEHDFENVEGVIEVVSGYTGGHVVDPTYEQVSAGGTGHVEAVLITFDPSLVSYEELLQIFWHNIDPTVKNRQFCDVGSQYRTEIFYHNDEQKRLAEASRDQLIASGRFASIATAITPATMFYAAEEYHQNYSDKNPVRYNFYRWNCGRDARLEELWGDDQNQ